MTMKREAKAEAEMILKGHKTEAFASPKNRAMCRAQGRANFNMTPAEYAAEYLGRHSSRGMAQTDKMRKMGFTQTERGSWKKITRK